MTRWVSSDSANDGAQIYEGEVEPWLMSDFCTEDVPVLIRRRNFCSSFAADARDFRTYNSWVLSLMLAQVLLRILNIHIHTHLI